MIKKIFAFIFTFAISTTIVMAGNILQPNQMGLKPDLTKMGKNGASMMNMKGNGPQLMTRAEAKKRFESQKLKEREMLYTALNLTIEQKTKAEELDKKTRSEATKYLKKVQEEATKLRELKNNKASKFALFTQKLAFKKAVANANKYFEKSRSSFESILTPEQKIKFGEIRAAKRAESAEARRKFRNRTQPNMPKSTK